MTGALFGQVTKALDDEVEEDCRVFGMDPAAFASAPPEEDEGVWPCHCDAVRAFLAICRQWRAVGTMSGVNFLGLDYAAAKAGLELAGIAVDPELWEQVRIVEAGARQALNEGKA